MSGGKAGIASTTLELGERIPQRHTGMRRREEGRFSVTRRLRGSRPLHRGLWRRDRVGLGERLVG
ncbi:MAG: hypothetical protein ACREI3_04110, partial [Nitrospirales bacterium]